MTINQYFKKWCNEDYDISKEEFYEMNTRYIAGREWTRSGVKHGIFIFIIALISFIGGQMGFWNNVLGAAVNAGILTVAFWFFGLRKYDSNDEASAVPTYFAVAIFLFMTASKVGTIAKIIFAIPTFALYIYLCIFKPIRFVPLAKIMKKKIIEEEKEEEKWDERSYEYWKSGYNSRGQEIPPIEEASNEDPIIAEVKALFEGHMDNEHVLKARYRQLAKQYHPDCGGDRRYFQTLVSVYEELRQKF